DPGTPAGISRSREPLWELLARVYDTESARNGKPERWDHVGWRRRQLVRVMWQATSTGDANMIAEAGWNRVKVWLAARSDAAFHHRYEQTYRAQIRALAVPLLTEAVRQGTLPRISGPPELLGTLLARSYDWVAINLGRTTRWTTSSWRQKQLVRVMWTAVAAGERNPFAVQEIGMAHHQKWVDTHTWQYRVREPEDRKQCHALGLHLIHVAEAAAAGAPACTPHPWQTSWSVPGTRPAARAHPLRGVVGAKTVVVPAELFVPGERR
ncbi:MAG TPA: hypothetical protein VFZ87_04485, partial [Gemmatimonadales bacterium]